MTKDDILITLKRMAPLEQMEITLELLISIFENSNLKLDSKLLYDELKFTLERLKQNG